MFTITVGRMGRSGRKTGTLAAREILLGRDAGSDLVLEDGVVSRTHCRLVAVEGGTLVMDEGSRNGTWVNGTAITEPTLLRFEDSLVIGPYSLQVRSLIGRGTAGWAQEPRVAPRSIAQPTREMPGAHAYWEVLGLRPGNSLDEARRAWRRLLKQYHPDKVAHLGPELRELAERKVRELNMAWQHLSRQCAASPNP